MVKLISFKLMFERTKQYIATVNFVMIAYLFIEQTQFNLVTTVILALLVLGVLSIVDFKYIYPKELGRASEKNPVLMEIRNDIKKLLQITEQPVNNPKSFIKNDIRLVKNKLSRLEEKG